MERVKIDLTKHLDNTALIHYRHDGSVDIIKYKDLLRYILKVGLVLESEEMLRSQFTTIGILCRKNPSAIALSLAIMEADFAFCFISKSDIPSELDKLGIKYFFSDENLQNDDYHTLRNSLDVFGQRIRLYKSKSALEIRVFKDLGDPMNRICYTITTSGTTGKKKIVRVTYNCIAPNVVCLQKIFRLHKDVIYSSAPCTFDVFVLDLFLALHSGSALMIMDESLRYSDESMNFMFTSESTGVTFIQITPSLFQQYGLDNIRNKILHKNSSLKYLVLGGEQFPPTKDVVTWQNWNDAARKRIFNIYGITEMSCWGMIHEVTPEDLELSEVPLGKLLDETDYGFFPSLDKASGIEEILFTTKTRICFVDDKDADDALGKDHYFAQQTGDLVKRSNGKIVYFGRRNDVVKKFGEKVDLNKIEGVASEVVSTAACIYMKKKVVLFLKVEDEHLTPALKKNLHAKLKSNEIPDEVRKINFFPLSEHGKVSKQKLKEIYKDMLTEDRIRIEKVEDSFLEAINQIFNMRLSKRSSASSDEPDGKRMKTDMDVTFKALGGSSFDALRISMRLEDQVGFSNGLLPKLLSDRHTIRDICHYLTDLQPNDTQQTGALARSSTSSISLKVIERFNLKKCIDATPALLKINKKSFISVGSHSHQLVTIDPESLKIISTTELGDRIESEVTLIDDNGLVGCYDGNLYCFNLQTGALKWKFNSQGMIKSKALVVEDLVIFGNYNYEKNFWCLHCDADGEMVLKWNLLVGTRGILATPIVVQNSTVLVCTLDGTCELLNYNSGATIWSKKLESPIFSTPRKIPGRSEILVAEVSKNVNCFTFNGDLLWKFETDGHIFSSFLFTQINDESMKILFGCHDKRLRCLDYNYERQSPVLVWSVELQSQIYGTPKTITIDSEEFVISCATNGIINLIKLSDGSIDNALKLSGEIFSTPVIYDNKIFVGCRDNYLYCIQF